MSSEMHSDPVSRGISREWALMSGLSGRIHNTPYLHKRLPLKNPKTYPYQCPMLSSDRSVLTSRDMILEFKYTDHDVFCHLMVNS